MIKRRTFVAAGSGFLYAACGRGAPASPFPSYLDSLTENTVARLTDPGRGAVLPEVQRRFVSSRNSFLICSMAANGTLAPHRIDLRNGQIQALATAANLVPSSLALDRGDRSLFFLDGTELRELSMSTRHTRTIAEGLKDFSLGGTGQLAVVRGRELEDGNGARIASGVDALYGFSPDGAHVLFARAESLSVCPFAPAAKTVTLVNDSWSNPVWSADSGHVLFLGGSDIRSAAVDSSVQTLVSTGSRFASFSANRDNSVFVGASASHAQPAVVLLVPHTRAELTLCEHRASDPASVRPVFSPDSRHVFFETDRRSGREAIYAVDIESFVERTE